jgi:putative cell wall-binding protein
VEAIERYAGPTRYDTAAAVARLLHPDGAETAVVATGTGYADALTAGVAAAALDAPLLLASADHVPTPALHELGVSDVLLIGGTAALPTSVRGEIEHAGFHVERISGTNRFETAAAVAEATRPDAEHVFRVDGESFERALVAAVHAARTDAQLLLVDDLDADVIEVDGAEVRGDVGALNRALLERDPPSSDSAVVATIATFPDALSATAMAGALDAAVLLTERWSATQAAVDQLDALDSSSLLVVGGTAAVSDRVLQQLLGFVPLPPEVAPGAEAAIARDLFDRANDERAARGMRLLVWDDGLASDASSWAVTMSQRGSATHAPLPPEIGENLHYPVGWCDSTGCHQPTSGLVHSDWMRSTGNRDNIVESAYVIAGVGVHCGPDGTLWAVARFQLGFDPPAPNGSPATPVVHPGIDGVGCDGVRS